MNSAMPCKLISIPHFEGRLLATGIQEERVTLRTLKMASEQAWETSSGHPDAFGAGHEMVILIQGKDCVTLPVSIALRKDAREEKEST
jgi:hypothetical protein